MEREAGMGLSPQGRSLRFWQVMAAMLTVGVLALAWGGEGAAGVHRMNPAVPIALHIQVGSFDISLTLGELGQ